VEGRCREGSYHPEDAGPGPGEPRAAEGQGGADGEVDLLAGDQVDEGTGGALASAVRARRSASVV